MRMRCVRYKRKNQGFTLVELIVVMAIMALLAGIAVYLSGIHQESEGAAKSFGCQTASDSSGGCDDGAEYGSG